MRPLFFIFLVIILAVFIETKGSQAKSRDPGIPGQFDYYVLNLSWEPEFCHSPRNQNSDECLNHQRGFVVHGLWPQFTEGYPENCSNAPSIGNPQSMTDIIPTEGLVLHEWATHGTCSGLSADNYFVTLRQAFNSVQIPKEFKSPKQSLSMRTNDIKHAFMVTNPGLDSADIRINCGHNYLTAVEICLNKSSLKPQQCGMLRDCRAEVIRLASRP